MLKGRTVMVYIMLEIRVQIRERIYDWVRIEAWFYGFAGY